MKRSTGFVCLAVLAVSILPRSAFAAFHLMEIEQVIGGVGGDTTAQAVQLKMRTTGQNFLTGSAQLVVRDAAGANPVLLATFASNPLGGACREILLATTAFASKTTPAAVPDYTMSAIPASYLAAGSLTFETLGGASTYWRVTWGDGAYSGSQAIHTGTGVSGIGNDGDGDSLTSLAFATALPSSSAKALQFTPACALTADETNNLAQYAVTSSAAVFKNNGLASFTVVAGPPIPGLPGVAKLILSALLGVGVLVFAIARRRRA